MNTTDFLIVIDTNVALDLWLFSHPGLEPLRLHLRRHRPLATAEMRAELSTVLARGAAGTGSIAGRWLEAGRSQEVLAEWDRHVELVEPPTARPGWPQCLDRDDQKFIDLALARRAGWLLSRDRQVLRMARACRGLGLVVAPPEALRADGAAWVRETARGGGC